MSGYIKLHRVFREWEWYDEPNMVHFFIHCLLKANHKNNKWKGVDVLEGQFISGRKILSSETGLSERSVRTCINKLEKTGELTIKTTSKYSLFTLNSWKKYQSNESTDQQNDQVPTKYRPSTDQVPTTNKNDKNDKNEKNEKEINTLDEFIDIWNSSSNFKTVSFRSQSTKSAAQKKINTRIKSFPDFKELFAKQVKKKLNTFTMESKWFNFDWVIRSDVNFEKWIDGNYDEQKKKTDVDLMNEFANSVRI